MSNDTNNDKRNELLRQLSVLGVSLDTPVRKGRSDKGKKRGPISKTRSDKGKRRISTNGVSKSKLAVYKSVRNKLLNRENVPDSYKVETDINGYYLLMVKDNSVINIYHQVTYHGQTINRNVKHVKGYTIDLEKYRFEALQELALTIGKYSIDKIPNIRQTFKNEYEQVKEILPPLIEFCTILDLFCAFYHINEEDAILWTYEKWLADYRIVADDILDLGFKFKITERPGTESFLPEYKDSVYLKELQCRESLKHSKQYIDFKAKTRDKIYADEFTQLRRDIMTLPESAQYSMQQLNRLINRMIDYDKLDEQLNKELEEWLDNHVNKENQYE